MQIKYSYIHADTYTTNNYNLTTYKNKNSKLQHYIKQTTITLQQQRSNTIIETIQQNKQFDIPKSKNQVLQKLYLKHHVYKTL